MRQFFDFVAFTLILSAITMIVALLLLAALDSFPIPSEQMTARLILEEVASLSVPFFGITALIIWGYGFAWFWRTLPGLTFKENAMRFIFLIGFSWLAGLIVYFRERKKNYCKK